MARKKDIQHWIKHSEKFEFKGQKYRVLDEHICEAILKDYND